MICLSSLYSLRSRPFTATGERAHSFMCVYVYCMYMIRICICTCIWMCICYTFIIINITIFVYYASVSACIYIYIYIYARKRAMTCMHDSPVAMAGSDAGRRICLRLDLLAGSFHLRCLVSSRTQVNCGGTGASKIGELEFGWFPCSFLHNPPKQQLKEETPKRFS